MKHNRFGRARVLSAEELDILISLLPSGAHRTLAHLLRRTSVRVSEGLKLRWEFIGNRLPILNASLFRYPSYSFNS